MDLSALIFLALAVAWAAYLIPKALKHQDVARRTRSIEVFSDRLRVLARRDAVSRRNAELLVDPDRPRRGDESDRPPTVGELRQQAANQAARRRRNVLAVLVLLLTVVLALGADGVISWWWSAGPVTLLVAWLVACRLMVKRERSVRVPSARPAGRPAPDSGDAPETAGTAGSAESTETGESAWSGEDTETSIPPVSAEPAVSTAEGESDAADDGDPSRWDMIPVTLPTYVSKPVAARRTVQTIDLDSTGVWSSGRSEIDSALAREAEVSERESREASAEAEKRASGS